MPADNRRRTRIVAELASNHGGDMEIAKDLIAACAEHGADVVKVQAYQAQFLAETDSQKKWLAQAELSPGQLLALKAYAQSCGVDLLVSVFDTDRADFVRKGLGCTEVKIGSGEIRRVGLIAKCIALFDVVWLGAGLDPRRAELFAREHGQIRPVYGVTQYPAESMFEREQLRRAIDHRGQWGWSDHGATPASSREAIDFGAYSVERHVAFLTRGRSDKHDSQPHDLRALRDYAEKRATVEWEESQAHAASEHKFLSRWEAADVAESRR